MLSKATKQKTISDLNDDSKQKVIDAANTIMSPCDKEACARASSVGLIVLQWVTCAIKQANIEVELSRIETTHIEQKRRVKAKDDWKILGVNFLGLGAMVNNGATRKWGRSGSLKA
ncbi:hypothetical protein CYMTET_32249 [Cymbomonas tetramitiformis]|uniref:Uncharacterized protein n=1 Tax=Cymbomonas tetramitiformis TaxID=36881 RepID=A0AAE0KS45_9CHLO|nr:hypothetical protein CYMTET_32249 [Cymbomonas tetramitiformis]